MLRIPKAENNLQFRHCVSLRSWRLCVRKITVSRKAAKNANIARQKDLGVSTPFDIINAYSQL
jgi:hypothetical protein